MCGRFSLTASNNKINLHYGTKNRLKIQQRYNVAPSTYCPIIRINEGKRELIESFWGLIPAWAAPEVKIKPINAKAETVAEKPYFRHAYKNQRCLVPATGYYEWKKQAGGKQPYYITLPDVNIFSFVGLWEYWEKGEQPITSFTIITTAATNQLTNIHPRMPVIINPHKYDAWLLNGDSKLLFPSDNNYDYFKISTKVNNPRNEGRGLIQPIYLP